MDENEVEGLRKEIGEKMARDNEGVPGDHSSDSLKEGYRRGIAGFGSNTTPRNFGKGGRSRPDWTCICGQENRFYYARCQSCGIVYELAIEAKE